MIQIGGCHVCRRSRLVQDGAAICDCGTEMVLLVISVAVVCVAVFWLLSV